MSEFEFDDTQASGIWWSTNVAIRDLCNELKSETNCSDLKVASLLRSISDSIVRDGL